MLIFVNRNQGEMIFGRFRREELQRILSPISTTYKNAKAHPAQHNVDAPSPPCSFKKLSKNMAVLKKMCIFAVSLVDGRNMVAGHAT